MTTHKQYYLTCDGCGKVHPERGEEPEEITGVAEDDGWYTNCQMLIFCTRCIELPEIQERQIR